jgi:hypothetical protein
MGVVKGAAGCISCYIRELVPAENGSCPTCEEGCTGGVNVIPQYYRCAGAGVGEGGREICASSQQQIGKYYPCKNRFLWGVLSRCILQAGVDCVVVCGFCVPPNLLGCAACIACVGALTYLQCGYCDLRICEKRAEQKIYRSEFSALLGESCVGE